MYCKTIHKKRNIISLTNTNLLKTLNKNKNKQISLKRVNLQLEVDHKERDGKICIKKIELREKD